MGIGPCGTTGREFGVKPVRYCFGGMLIVVAQSALAAELGGRLW